MSTTTALLQVPTPRKRPPSDNEQTVLSQPLKKIQVVDPRKDVINHSAIVDRILHCFPDHDVLSIPCKAARLFACFTLVADQSNDQADDEIRESRGSGSIKHIKPIYPLLSALVLAEKTSLGSLSTSGTVQFSGFDCSSTQPPVDSVYGSIQHREAEIEALSEALDQVHALRDDVENKNESITCLRAMIKFLRDMETSEGKDLRVECAKTISAKWNSKRFKKAARTYRLDFEKLLNTIMTDENAPSQPLFLEKRLADSLGQAIRFYLRAFFNPVPWKKPTDGKVEAPAVQQSKHQSRVSELLIMKLPDGLVVADTAVADGAISSVFSAALRIVYLHFGADVFLSDDYRPPTLPENFCNSEASQKGPGKKRSPISDEAVDAIVSDIHNAQSFRDAAVACRFLSNLLNFPGVREEIIKVCGWVCVEKHANRIKGYKLIELCPDDAHLVLLSDTNRFFARIDSYKMAVEKLIAPCEQRLEQLAITFKCGPNHKLLRRNYPILETIDAAMDEGFVFPNVAVVARPQY
jgi:hypothetical protein